MQWVATFLTSTYFAKLFCVQWTLLEKVWVWEGVNICVKLETQYFKPRKCPWDTWKATRKASCSFQCISYSQWNGNNFIYWEMSLLLLMSRDVLGKTHYDYKRAKEHYTVIFHYGAYSLRKVKVLPPEFLASYIGPTSISFSIVSKPSPSLPQNTTMTHLCTYKSAIPNI